MYDFFCIVFKIVNTEKKNDLKLCIDDLENKKKIGNIVFVFWEYSLPK